MAYVLKTLNLVKYVYVDGSPWLVDCTWVTAGLQKMTNSV